MLKRQSGIRREQMDKARGGVGVTIFDHLLEKTEMKTNCRMFTKITLEPGASIGYHRHDKEEDIYYILSGIATINDNGETRTVYPGEVVYTGDGQSHSVENKGQVPLELVSVILTYEAPER
ncbi:MAG: cupin domain-containing protein [Spirochaetes bacterium]|nr:cupin domain-containing protein [Spirochaetota bacterium]